MLIYDKKITFQFKKRWACQIVGCIAVRLAKNNPLMSMGENMSNYNVGSLILLSLWFSLKNRIFSKAV